VARAEERLHRANQHDRRDPDGNPDKSPALMSQ
jgi:hypothetical protein